MLLQTIKVELWLLLSTKTSPISSASVVSDKNRKDGSGKTKPDINGETDMTPGRSPAALLQT